MKLSKWLLPGGLIACMAAFNSNAEPLCVAVHQLAATQLKVLATGRSSSVHETLKFPKDSQCLGDNTSHRQAVLVALAEPPLQVTVSSIAHRKKGLMPVFLTVLDANWNPIVTHAFDTFTQRGMRHSVSFHVDPVAHPRYLLIEADQGQLGQSGELVSGLSSTVIWAGGGFMGTITNGSEQTIQMPFVEFGEVDIEFSRFDADFSSR